ncbi:unnamed protein product [Sphagnum jensenii]|uniref:Pentatricopeptide repeat-containing protein n=1 Tax=Sphagnum jensenii TaxID=128206 RepID=A0ABP1AM99_9BRYO
MYAKCGSISDAWRVFDRMATQDVISWTAMILGLVKNGQVLEDATKVFNSMATHDVASWTAIIAGHVKSGQEEKALKLWQQMRVERVQPAPVTLVQVLNACASVAALEEGRWIHDLIIHRGYDSDVFLGNSLIDMYAKCGSIEDAERVFTSMVTRNVVSWNAIILGYSRYETNILVGNSLVDMYAKCGSIEDAQSVFNNMTTRNVISWTNMIWGRVKCGHGQKALELSQQMQSEGVQPDHVTFVGLLSACASVGAFEEGKKIHKQIIQNGCESDVFVGSSLVDMYTKCGSLQDAQSVFDRMATRNVFSWTALIFGYVNCGQGQKALELSRQMQHEGVQPDNVSISNSLIDMYVKCGSIADAQQVFNSMATRDVVSWNAMILVNMYAKCGSIEDAQRVFNNMASHDVVSWTAMILAHVNCGQAWKALELSQQMQNQGVQPDHVTFVGILNACSSLIDMYTKCGSIEDAQRVFNRMVTPDVIAWTAMLRGHAMHGRGREAIQHFEQMGQDGVEIDDVTFIALLSACNHAGLVDEGLHCFESMGSVYSIPATVKHYACMVDLLGRAGHLQEAQDLIKSGLGSAEDAAVWRSLLGACRIHGDVEMGENIAIRVIELDPGNDAAYVLLSNIYAAAGKWDLRAKVQQLRLDRGVEKQVGSTWIEVKNEVQHISS